MPAPVEKTIGNLRVSTTPLLFTSAQPLIPTMMELIAIATQDLAGLVASKQIDLKGNLSDPAVAAAMLPGLRGVSAFLNGRLETLAPKILATTRVAAPISSGDVEWHDMSNLKDRSFIFDEYPESYFPILIHAGVVSFGRFFPGRGRRGTEEDSSTSKVSSPST